MYVSVRARVCDVTQNKAGMGGADLDPSHGFEKVDEFIVVEFHHVGGHLDVTPGPPLVDDVEEASEGPGSDAGVCLGAQHGVRLA